MFPPNIASKCSSNNDKHFPDPDGEKYDPVAPFYGVVQPQGKEQRKQQQTGEDQELTENKTHQIKPFGKIMTWLISNKFQSTAAKPKLYNTRFERMKYEIIGH